MTLISSAAKVAICPVAKLVPSTERFFIQSEGFGQNLEWALNLDLISKQLIQELKRNETITFTQIVKDMGKKYGDFYRKHKISKHNGLILEKKTEIHSERLKLERPR